MGASSLFGGIGRALRHRNYRLYWAGSGTSTTGRWMFQVAVGWLTWELTRSTTWLGIIAFAQTFPIVLFAAVGGAIGDRAGFLGVLKVTQLAAAAVAALFAYLVIADLITIEWVLVLTFLLGSADALGNPSKIALVNTLVPGDDLAAAIALNSATFNAARFVGPAIAGMMIASVSVGAVIAANAVTFISFWAVLAFVRPREEASRRSDSDGFLLAITEGVRYVWRHPGIWFLMVILAAMGVFVRPYMELFPGFSAAIFDRGSAGLSILLSATGFGAMFAGLWLAQRGQTQGLTRIVTLTTLIAALALFLFAVIGVFWIAAASAAVVGFCFAAGAIAALTLIQNVTGAEIRGRVIGIFIIISWGVPALGALALGWAASFFGLPATVATGAALALIVWLWARLREARMAETLEDG